MPDLTPIIPIADESASRGHSLFPPSAATRWMTCKASPLMVSQYGVFTTNPDAEEGTRAHSVMEQCAIALLRDGEEIDTILKRVEDQELRECARIYLEEIRDSYFDTPDSWIVEGRIPLSPIYGVPDQYGYADCILSSGNELHVFDYKHGVGIPVPAERNKQLMIYAWAALQADGAQDIDTITLHIVQPRAPGQNPVNTWTCSREDLRAFGVDVALAVGAANEIMARGAVEGDFTPTEQACRYCPARSSCPAFVTVVSKALSIPKRLPTPRGATNDQLGALLQFKKQVNDWFSDVEAEVFNRISLGNDVPGFKIVEGNKGIRRWKNKAEAEEVLKSMRIPKDYAYKKEVIGPTRAEELHKKVKREDGKPVIGERQWATLQELITRNPGKPQLVPASDKRPSISLALVTEDDLEEIADGTKETTSEANPGSVPI